MQNLKHQGGIPGWPLLAAAIIISLSGLLLYLAFHLESKRRINNLILRETEQLTLQKNRIAIIMNSILTDLEYLSGSHYVEMLQADKKTYNKELLTDLLEFNSAKRFYSQIRFLSTDGMEIVSITCDREGKSVNTPTTLLKNRANRYYFIESQHLSPKQVYISPLSIPSHDVITPAEPTLHLTTPLFDNHHKIGFIVINYRAEHLLEKTKFSNWLLLNHNGGWVCGGGDLDWKFQSNPQAVLASYNSKLWHAIKENCSGYFRENNKIFFFTKIDPFQTTENKLVASHIQPPQNAPDYCWYLLHILENPDEATALLPLRNILLSIWGAIAIGTIIATSWITRQLAAGRRKELRHQMIFQHATDPYLIIANNQIVDCNPSALNLFGISDYESIRGVHLDKFFPPTQPDGSSSLNKRNEIIERLKTSSTPITFPWCYCSPDREDLIHVEETLIPPNSDPNHMILSILHNVTGQHLYAEELKNKAAIDELIGTLAQRFLSDPLEQAAPECIRQTCEFLNAIIGTFYIYTLENTYHLKWSWTHHQADITPLQCLDAKNMEPVLVAMQQNKVMISGPPDQAIVSPHDILSKTGTSESIWVPVLRHDTLLGFFKIVFKHKIKWTADHIILLRRFAENLAAAINRHEIEKILAREKEKADMASQAKSEFLANMSHEIRTPLNAIIGFTEILNSTITDHQSHQYLDAILSGGKNLLALINDILELSRIEAGKIKLEYHSIDLPLLFNEMHNFFHETIKEKGLEFKLELSPDMPHYILFDEIRLRQIIFNLLGNAVKFTTQGHVRLAATTLINPATPTYFDLIFVIEDTGIGISPERQMEIFGSDEEMVHHYNGSGLGVPIVRRLLRLLNGELTVSSEIGHGCRIKVTIHEIKIVTSTAETQRNIPEQESPIEDVMNEDISFIPTDVIIIDDHPDNRFLLAAYLEDTGLRIHVASDGEEGLEKIRNIHPSLIISDLKMPKLNGDEMIQKIRNDISIKNIPVILLTGSISEQSNMSFQDQIQGYLSKPVKRAIMLKEMAKFLKTCPSSKHSSNLEIPSEWESVTLAPEFQNQLKSILEHDYPLIKNTGSVDAISAFALSLGELGEKASCKVLVRYAEALTLAQLEFDITNIKKLLQEFPQIVKNKSNISQ